MHAVALESASEARLRWAEAMETECRRKQIEIDRLLAEMEDLRKLLRECEAALQAFVAGDAAGGASQHYRRLLRDKDAMLQDLENACRDREAIILDLQRACEERDAIIRNGPPVK